MITALLTIFPKVSIRISSLKVYTNSPVHGKASG